MNAGELDGLIIAEEAKNPFTKNVAQVCKFYDVPKVGIADLFNFNPFNPVHMLDTEKVYMPYLEANIIDACNLNCKGCTHFAKLFNTSELYSIETFRRDVRRISQICDVQKFRLLGGEPLLLKNLDEYIKISRKYLPKTDLRIVTNGLLIPSLPPNIFDAIRGNNCIVDISAYPPTLKMADKIKSVLSSNKILFNLDSQVKDKFAVFMTLNPGNNPARSRTACIGSDGCRFLRDGKIYKCPTDALSYRFAERFGLKNYPKATGVDIYASNFSALLPMLDGNVEMCHWCSDRPTRMIPWETSTNPQLEDWLADPDELKNFA